MQEMRIVALCRRTEEDLGKQEVVKDMRTLLYRGPKQSIDINYLPNPIQPLNRPSQRSRH